MASRKERGTGVCVGPGGKRSFLERLTPPVSPLEFSVTPPFAGPLSLPQSLPLYFPTSPSPLPTHTLPLPPNPLAVSSHQKIMASRLQSPAGHLLSLTDKGCRLVPALAPTAGKTGICHS